MNQRCVLATGGGLFTLLGLPQVESFSAQPTPEGRGTISLAAQEHLMWDPKGKNRVLSTV